MMNDYDWHQNTGELPEYFDDDESDYRNSINQPNNSQSDGAGVCLLVVIVIIVVGILVWLI